MRSQSVSSRVLMSHQIVWFPTQLSHSTRMTLDGQPTHSFAKLCFILTFLSVFALEVCTLEGSGKMENQKSGCPSPAKEGCLPLIFPELCPDTSQTFQLKDQRRVIPFLYLKGEMFLKLKQLR